MSFNRCKRSGLFFVNLVKAFSIEPAHAFLSDENERNTSTVEFAICLCCAFRFFDIVFLKRYILFTEMSGGFFTVSAPTGGIHNDGFAFNLCSCDQARVVFEGFYLDRSEATDRTGNFFEVSIFRWFVTVGYVAVCIDPFINVAIRSYWA